MLRLFRCNECHVIHQRSVRTFGDEVSLSRQSCNRGLLSAALCSDLSVYDLPKR